MVVGLTQEDVDEAEDELVSELVVEDIVLSEVVDVGQKVSVLLCNLPSRFFTVIVMVVGLIHDVVEDGDMRSDVVVV